MKTPAIAMLAALGGLQAAVAQRIGSTGVWIDATTCDPWAKSNGFPAAAGSGGLFTTALRILDEITHAGLYRIYNPSKQSPTTLPANVLAWERYRLNSTYDAFFGNNTDTKAYNPGVYNVACKLYSWSGERQRLATNTFSQCNFGEFKLNGGGRRILASRISSWSAMMPRICRRTTTTSLFTVSVKRFME